MQNDLVVLYLKSNTFVKVQVIGLGIDSQQLVTCA
jgi:hypothetical protein